VAQAGRVRDERVGELLGHLGGEEAGVRVGHAVDLGVDRGKDVGMAVPQARDRRAAARVDVLLPIPVGDGHALGGDGDGKLPAQAAMEDVAHGSSFGGALRSPSTCKASSKRATMLYVAIAAVSSTISVVEKRSRSNLKRESGTRTSRVMVIA